MPGLPLDWQTNVLCCKEKTPNNKIWLQYNLAGWNLTQDFYVVLTIYDVRLKTSSKEDAPTVESLSRTLRDQLRHLDPPSAYSNTPLKSNIIYYNTGINDAMLVGNNTVPLNCLSGDQTNFRWSSPSRYNIHRPLQRPISHLWNDLLLPSHGRPLSTPPNDADMHSGRSLEFCKGVVRGGHQHNSGGTQGI